MKSMHWIAVFVWVAIAGLSVGHAQEYVDGRELIFAKGEIPPDARNPFNMLVFLSNTEPVLDSKGEPHDHGHLIQVIADGGNRIQDPPDPDGSPGGDDSLALGNFNMIMMRGYEEPFDDTGKSGMFFSFRYFIPMQREGVYYLRLWEGDNIESAPYYQNSSEYLASNGDQGGGMLRLSPQVLQGPMDTSWRFTKPTPRPKK